MSRKGENIYKRKDGRWEGRYIKERSLSGKAKYGYIYAQSYREAKQKVITAVHANEYECMIHKTNDKKKIFQKAAEDWFSSAHSQWKESTCVKYQNLLNSYIFPQLGDIPLDKITHDCIEKYCTQMLLTGGCKGTGLSSKTVSDTLSLIRNILKFAHNTGEYVPYDGKSITLKQSCMPMRILSQNEQEQLCHYLYTEHNLKNLGIFICLFTGIRIGELCALKWEDISLDEKTIYVHQTMQRIQTQGDSKQKTKVIVSAPKSSCSIRKIPIPDNLFHIITDYHSNLNGYVLTGSEVMYVEPRTMQNHFKRILLKSKLSSVNFHVLRHTFATRCVELGFDVKSLSEILGHANINITLNRYVHPSMELKRQNMQKLSVLFTVK